MTERRVGGWLGLILLGVAATATATAAPPATADWRELEPGLEVAHFDSRRQEAAAVGDMTVLRVAPSRFALRMFATGSEPGAAERTIDQWCRDFDLVAAVNAGMYQADRRTHVGFCQLDGRVVNGFTNDYLSAVAVDPRSAADPPFRIFDLDETPLAEIQARYRTVLQNLRLIKHERENRWQPSTDKWREVALAEDGRGRILLIFCRTPWPMARFNEILLGLPLEVSAAQHLEGRNQARLRVNHPTYEGGPEGEASGPLLPFVLGVVRRVATDD